MIISESCGVSPRSISEPADEADRGRHIGFARYKCPAGGPGSLSLTFGRLIMRVTCLFACGIGLLSATGALLAAAATAIDFSIAKAIFVFGLLLAFSASVMLLNSARYWGFAGILVGVLLIVLSFLPIYIKHVGDPDNPRSHRHILWWLDYVH